MATSCQSLGFNVPADKFTLDEVHEKVTVVSSAVNEFAVFHYPITTGGTDTDYTVVADGLTELYDGLKITIKPHVNATVSNITLNVNELGAKRVYRRNGEDTSAVVQNTDLWLKADIPVSLTYSATLNAFLVDGGGAGGGSGEAGGAGLTKMIPLPLITATEEGQTVFPIELSGFDPENDSVTVQSGITILHPGSDFTVVGNTVVLSEGVPIERTVGIVVWKNVITTEQVGEMAAKKSSVVEDTLLAANWADSQYVWENVDIVSGDQIIELLPAKTITAEQLTALQGANIIGVDQAAGSVTMKAFGAVPSIDIPVVFILRGDV